MITFIGGFLKGLVFGVGATMCLFMFATLVSYVLRDLGYVFP